jgi:hypothetical protein
MSPFDFVREIQSGKRNLMADPQSEKEYVPFVVNKALSYDLDCIMAANEMNQRHHLDKSMQYGYLLNTIRARKRPFHKWIKIESSDIIDAIKLFFECSTPKAHEILGILTPDQLAAVKEITQEGGRVTRATKT